MDVSEALSSLDVIHAIDDTQLKLDEKTMKKYVNITGGYIGAFCLFQLTL